MICQCENCGRVRVNNLWLWDAKAVPDVIGFCPTCSAWREKLGIMRRAREGRQLLQNRKRGYGLPLEDAFKGFEEGEK